MNKQSPIPFEAAAEDDPLRIKRGHAYNALQRYRDTGKEEELTQAEGLAWDAYSTSITDEDLYSAHILIAKIYTLQGRFGNAEYNVKEALGLKPDDKAALDLQDRIQEAMEAAKPIGKSAIQLPEIFNTEAPHHSRHHQPKRQPSPHTTNVVTAPVVEVPVVPVVTAATTEPPSSPPQHTQQQNLSSEPPYELPYKNEWPDFVKAINAMNPWNRSLG